MNETSKLIEDFFNQEIPHAEDRFIELSIQIAQEVNKARKLKNSGKGWSLRKLAKAAGMQAPHLTRALGGQHNFTIQTIAKLEAALEVPLLEVCRREALSFVERGLPGHPSAATRNAAKLRAILEDEEHHHAYTVSLVKAPTLEPAGNTSFAMAA